MKQKNKNPKKSKPFNGGRVVHIKGEAWHWKCGINSVTISDPKGKKYTVQLWKMMKESSHDIEIIRDGEIYLTTEDSNYLPVGHEGITPSVVKEYVENELI